MTLYHRFLACLWSLILWNFCWIFNCSLFENKNDASIFRSSRFRVWFAFEGDIEATSASIVLKRRGCAATRASSATMGHMEKEYKPRRDRYSFDIHRSFNPSLFKRTLRVTIHRHSNIPWSRLALYIYLDYFIFISTTKAKKLAL